MMERTVERNLLAEHYKRRYEMQSKEVREKLDRLSEQDPREYQVKILKRKRIIPQKGDVFVVSPREGVYYCGVVVNAGDGISDTYSAVVFILDKEYESMDIDVAELDLENLLFYPQIVDKGYWSRGYFYNIGKQIEIPNELDYGFYDVVDEYYVDEYGNRIMRETDADSITYLHNAASIGRWYATFGEPADAEEMTVITKRTGVPTTTPLYAYVLPSMGVTLARLCKMNGHWLLLMGRLFNLCGTAAIMAFALFLLPGAKKYFCVLGLLPEVIYILASYSYDALNLALCFLSVAYFFYMIDEGKKVTIRNILIFVGIVFLMIPIKLVYAPLLGLLLLIPREQLSVNKKMIIAAGALGACAVGALLVSRWRDIVVLLRGINYNEDGNAVSLAYILENPRSVLFVLLNDIEFNFDYYIKSMLGEFVGRDRFEGKFEFDLVYLPLWMNMLLGLLLGFGINRERKAENKPWKRVWSFWRFAVAF